MSQLVLRTTAYLACLYSFGLFATAMGIVGVHVAGVQPAAACTGPSCTTAVAVHAIPDGLTNPAHVSAVAAVLWSKTKLKTNKI